jgi:hypothetical protein
MQYSYYGCFILINFAFQISFFFEFTEMSIIFISYIFHVISINLPWVLQLLQFSLLSYKLFFFCHSVAYTPSTYYNLRFSLATILIFSLIEYQIIFTSSV